MKLYSRVALSITTKQGKMVPLRFNRAQDLVNAKIEERLEESGRVRCLILKARQEGMSTFVAARIYRGCTLWGHRRGLVIADKSDRAGEIFTIYERFENNVPLELKPPKASGLRKKEVAWTTDSRISVETAGDTEAGRGYTLQYLHASEQAMWDRADETWTAIMQSVPMDGGEVYVESTAKGVGNLFHRLWMQAEAGESDWLPIFLPWWIHEEYQLKAKQQERDDIVRTTDPFERLAQDVGIELEGELHKLTVEQLTWRRRKIRDDLAGDERQFRQEFPATAQEAFLVSGNAFFDEEALLDYLQGARKPARRGNLETMGGGLVLRPADKGYLSVWEPPNAKVHYVIGVDTATGRQVTKRRDTEERSEMGGRDYSCAMVIACCEFSEDTQSWERCIRQVASYHGHIVPEVFAEGLWRLGYYYSSFGSKGVGRPALIAVERNHSSGQTVLRELREKLRYPSLYYNRRFNTRLRKPTEYLGWVTDVTSRQPLLDGLAAAVREYAIVLPDANTIREMTTFVRGEQATELGGKPEAQEGCHDDRVIALAISHEMMRYHLHDPVGELPTWERAPTLTGV